MKQLSLLAISFILIFTACGSSATDKKTGGESSEIKENRPSPLKTVTGSIDGTDITINYGSPAVKGRKIWGELVPYQQIWRTGADEATTISFSKDVVIEGQPVKAGKYALFTIPGEQEWTLVLNTMWDQWGAYDYDEKNNVLRITLKPSYNEPMAERMDFSIEGNTIILRWEKLRISFEVKAGK
jgi:hypothetical protein